MTSCIIFLGKFEKCCFKKNPSNDVKKPHAIHVWEWTLNERHIKTSRMNHTPGSGEYCYPSSRWRFRLKHTFSVVSYPHVRKYKTRVLKSCSHSSLSVWSWNVQSYCHHSTIIPSQHSSTNTSQHTAYSLSHSNGLDLPLLATKLMYKLDSCHVLNQRKVT